MVTTHGEPLCDFCSSRDIRWAYPALNVDVDGSIVGSVEAWAACDKCHILIETGDWEELGHRSYDTNVLRPLMEQLHLEAGLLETTLLIHKAFQTARLGPAIKLPGKG